MSHDVIRRLLDDAYRAQESGMCVGLPRVSVDALQLRRLLAAHDYYEEKTYSNEHRAKRYMSALYNIMYTCDGDDDSTSAGPAEIARAALEGGQEGNPND